MRLGQERRELLMIMSLDDLPCPVHRRLKPASSRSTSPAMMWPLDPAETPAIFPHSAGLIDRTPRARNNQKPFVFRLQPAAVRGVWRQRAEAKGSDHLHRPGLSSEPVPTEGRAPCRFG